MRRRRRRVFCGGLAYDATPPIFFKRLSRLSRRPPLFFTSADDADDFFFFGSLDWCGQLKCMHKALEFPSLLLNMFYLTLLWLSFILFYSSKVLQKELSYPSHTQIQYSQIQKFVNLKTCKGTKWNVIKNCTNKISVRINHFAVKIRFHYNVTTRKHHIFHSTRTSLVFRFFLLLFRYTKREVSHPLIPQLQ